MKPFKKNLLIFCCLWLVSCFEVKETVFFRAKGGGTYLLRLDFTASQSVLTAVENDLRKYQQPYEQLPLEKISQAFQKKALAMQQIEGVSNITWQQNGYAWELAFDFHHQKALNCAIAELEIGISGEACWQTYYLTEKKMLQKNNTFYLRNLFENIHQHTFSNDVHLQQMLNQIIEQAQYTICIVTGKRIKKTDNPAFVQTNPTTLELTRKINTIHSPNLRWDVKIFLRRK